MRTTQHGLSGAVIDGIPGARKAIDRKLSDHQLRALRGIEEVLGDDGRTYLRLLMRGHWGGVVTVKTDRPRNRAYAADHYVRREKLTFFHGPSDKAPVELPLFAYLAQRRKELEAQGYTVTVRQHHYIGHKPMPNGKPSTSTTHRLVAPDGTRYWSKQRHLAQRCWFPSYLIRATRPGAEPGTHYERNEWVAHPASFVRYARPLV
jgi:hypothetical protein